ncbi:MAG: antitoxin family protein [Acidobacteria bacterium]|nr:antitoxin family protein [Acidobacteriota bacterium]
MRLVEARYEKGILRPTEPLPLRSGESVNLIVVRRPDPSRWDITRLAKSETAEDLTLAEMGIEDWAAKLDEEDQR